MSLSSKFELALQAAGYVLVVVSGIIIAAPILMGLIGKWLAGVICDVIEGKSV